LLLFVLEFPRPFHVAWRERVRRSILPIFIVLAVMTLYPDIANQLLARGARIENDILQALFGLTFALAIFVLCDTYRRVARDERERLRWVLIGFGFGLVTSYVGATLIFSTLFALAPPPGVSIALTSLNVLLPIAVAHAVIRHRVLEIRLVIGRALVFAALTTILAAIFALLDYFFGTVLEDFRISRLIAAVISLAIAFTFKWLEERATATIESVFFRKRRAAEARLARAVHALPQARSVTVIQTALVGEAADAFELTSAALYERDGTAGFRRTASAGWDGDRVTLLDDTDLLVLDLRADDDPVDLSEVPWRRDDVPADERKPAVAVPVHVRGNLLAFTLYGSHADGGALETSEIELLKRLADAAGVAFDQLEAERLRAENERQRVVIGDLTARLDELRQR
jgi:GAF domain-containing protein